MFGSVTDPVHRLGSFSVMVMAVVMILTLQKCQGKAGYEHTFSTPSSWMNNSHQDTFVEGEEDDKRF